MVISVLDLVEGCDTNAQGAVVYDRILPIVHSDNVVVLDFTGVFNVTSSFVNTAFVDLLDQVGVVTFKKCVKIQNVGKQAANLIKSRVSAYEAKRFQAA